MKRSTIALGILGIVVIVLGFFQTPLMRTSRGFIWNIWTRTIAQTFGIDDAYQDNSIENRLQELLSENAHLKAELYDYHRLRAELGTLTANSLRPVPAAVVARPIDTLQSELIVSRGIGSGIAIGDPVVVRDSTLIGFVTATQQNSATIQTLLHPSTHVTAEAVNDDEEAPPARGLLQSKLYASLYLSTIPRDVDIKEGQSIVTVSEDAKTPPGLVIGTITSIESQEHDAYQSARVTPPYDIDTLRAVTILTQP